MEFKIITSRIDKLLSIIKIKNKKQSGFFVIANKTFRDICKINRSIAFIIITTIIPFIVAYAGLGEVKNFPLEMQILTLRDILFFTTYIWVAGIPLAFFAGITISGFIAGEVNEGTLLSLVSKPVRRWEIIFGKFFAYFIYILILETIAIFSTTYILVTVSGCHLSVFNSLIKYLPLLILYTIFVALIFGAIPLALSVIFKKTSLIILVIAGITIMSYFGFFIVRMAYFDYYEKYHLYHVDLGYHIGNIFVLLLDNFGIRPTPMFQFIMSLFSGTYDTSGMAIKENDQEFWIPQFQYNDYYSQIKSFFLWVFFPVALLFIAMIKIYKKDIS